MLAWFPGRCSEGRECALPISKTDESHGEYSLWEYPLVEKRLVKTKGRDRSDLEWGALRKRAKVGLMRHETKTSAGRQQGVLRPRRRRESQCEQEVLNKAMYQE